MPYPYIPKQKSTNIFTDAFPPTAYRDEKLELLVSIFKNPVLAFQFTISPFLHPIESWNRTSELGTVTYLWVIVLFCVFGGFWIRYMEYFFPLETGGGYIRRQGQRDVLRKLVQAGTMDELWDEVQVLCVKEGVKRDSKKWVAERFAGFKNTKTEEEFAQNVRRIFEVGKESVLRELRGVESLDEIREICEENRREVRKYKGKMLGEYSEKELRRLVKRNT
jgi:hypothetical protein